MSPNRILEYSFAKSREKRRQASFICLFDADYKEDDPFWDPVDFPSHAS
jgi:hypothetical protein